MMARDYLLGSAMDPNPANKDIRQTVERKMVQRLIDAGASRFAAVDVAAGIVINYLTTGRYPARMLIRFLAGSDSLYLLAKMVEDNE